MPNQFALRQVVRYAASNQTVYRDAVWNTWTGPVYVTTADDTWTGWARWNTTDDTWAGWNTTFSYAANSIRVTRLNESTVIQDPDELRKAEEERKAVRERALQLFLSLLTVAQRREYDAHRRITVIGSSGREYRIRCEGQAGNVWLVEADKEVAAFCAHPFGVPDADAWVAQKLALECNDEAFLLTANVNRGAFPAGSLRAQLQEPDLTRARRDPLAYTERVAA